MLRSVQEVDETPSNLFLIPYELQFTTLLGMPEMLSKMDTVHSSTNCE